MAIRHRTHAADYLRLGFILITGFLGAYLLASISGGVLQELLKLLRANDAHPPRSFSTLLPFALLGALGGAYVGNSMIRWTNNLAEKWDKMDSGDKVTMFLGSFCGLVVTLPFLLIIDRLGAPVAYMPLLILGMTIGFAAICVYALQSMDEILPWNRGRGKTRRRGIKILDTNVIIDGRIADVARTGFLEGQLYVPGFVLDELQYIADSHDALRRQRGRRGLEVLRHMQADFPLEVRTHDRLVPEMEDGVDGRLMRLAKAIGGDIVTNDFNLNRVAKLQDITVLNLNDLSLSLRSTILPQETLGLAISREGSQPGQGVGYLEDGTMVVVENGRPYLGETVEVIVTQVIQTERGKMIFAEIGEDDDPDAPPRKRPNPKAR